MVISNHAKGPVATVETSGVIMIFARKIPKVRLVF